MIKFFRTIRKSLVMENKTGKYFKYAIGEIVLVMIGILLALQVNNWNEVRKTNVKEVKFLEGFKKDLLANKIELNRVIEKTDKTSNSSDSILQFQRGDIEALNLRSFIRCMMNATGFTVYQTQEGTIQDIMGSGNLDVIRNDSIRLAIGSWQANLKDLREWEKLDKNSHTVYNEFLQNNLKVYLRGQKELPLDEVTMNKFLENDLFLNRIETRKRYPDFLNNLYKKEIPKLDILLVLVNSELENRQ